MTRLLLCTLFSATLMFHTGCSGSNSSAVENAEQSEIDKYMALQAEEQAALSGEMETGSK
ncbi:hypothetical protein LOC71_02630 [Rhodopirellula sp. JC740]|uniref:Secreted protein n=1 Tax=Rhodopirellula halodulae TaxID=2894198 RepID=A0ABS8NC63_9BACT|nr:MULTISPECIES: hypothetical protein [unclassified Rhodopirellula]MCC9641153.1 hypothetical protein [Rhodopirellula sp. JC740]MCC9657561.1 hypothetical protein [Rhodopirellula sp. JC737]